MKTNTRKKIFKSILCLLCAVLVLSALLGCADMLRRFWRDFSIAASQQTDAEKAVYQFAMDNGLRYSDYPQSLIDLLDRNPETEAFVLNYPLRKDEDIPVDLSSYAGMETVPLFLQWDPQWGYLKYGSDVAGLTGCGPVCLAMTGYFLTEDSAFSPDRVIRFALENGYCVPGNGTSWTLISEGSKKLGLNAKELPLDKNIIFRNLQKGYPVICVMGPGDFTTTGHYIVLTGIKDGLICVNDPNSTKNSEKLWDYEDIYDQIRNLWAISLPES